VSDVLRAPGPEIHRSTRVGMLCLILSEASFFSVFIVAYLFYIGKSLSGPRPAEVLDFPLFGTLCLLSSSATIAIAVRDLRRGEIARFGTGLLATALLGVGFLTLTAIEWRRLIFGEGLTIGTNLFGTTFYSLVGFHAAHVTVGVLLMSLVLGLAARGDVRREHAEKVEMLSWYWHFVDAVWLAVLTTVYVVGV
jgi:cytochrome c oxidase subunit 3